MVDMRKCIGSAKFGIEAHEAPVDDFPAQPSQKDGLGRMCKPHWKQYTSALRKAALARKAAEGDGATEAAAAETASAHAAPAGVGRPRRPSRPSPSPIGPGPRAALASRPRLAVRRATPDSRSAPTRLSDPGRKPGVLSCGGVSGHAPAHRGTWANGGAHGPTWAGPGSATSDIFAKLGRVHTVAKAQSAFSRGPIWATPPRSASTDAPFVELHDRHSTAVLRDVERRPARGERHDVIDGEVGGGVGRALVARAPVAVLATPGSEHAGAQTLPGPRAVQGVVPAAVRLAGMLGAAATSAAGDDAADRAQLHPQIVGGVAGGVYSPAVLRPRVDGSGVAGHS